jgi:predicted PurR-regulated permease PerM
MVILVGAAATVIVLAGVQAVAWLIGPAFMALIIVIAVAPAQSWLRSHGWPGWATTLVVILLVYAIMVGLALGIIFSVARLATELPKYASTAEGLVTSATAELAALGVGPEQLAQARSSLNLGSIAGLLGSLLSSVAGLASNLVFLLALLLFLSVEAGGTGDRLASIAADRPRIAEALGHFAWGTRQYLLVTTVFGLIVAVLDSVALALMGIPLAVTWGLLSFITNYIPNVGFIIGVVPPALLALLTGGPQLMVIVIVVYCAINFVVQSIIQPRFIGDAVGLSVTVTFLALVFWAWLLGPLGAILAIPLTLLAKALLVDIDPQAKWADALLRDTPKEPDPDAPAGKSRREQQEQDLTVSGGRSSAR